MTLNNIIFVGAVSSLAAVSLSGCGKDQCGKIKAKETCVANHKCAWVTVNGNDGKCAENQSKQCSEHKDATTCKDDTTCEWDGKTCADKKTTPKCPDFSTSEKECKDQKVDGWTNKCEWVSGKKNQCTDAEGQSAFLAQSADTCKTWGGDLAFSASCSEKCSNWLLRPLNWHDTQSKLANKYTSSNQADLTWFYQAQISGKSKTITCEGKGYVMDKDTVWMSAGPFCTSGVEWSHNQVNKNLFKTLKVFLNNGCTDIGGSDNGCAVQIDDANENVKCVENPQATTKCKDVSSEVAIKSGCPTQCKKNVVGSVCKLHEKTNLTCKLTDDKTGCKVTVDGQEEKSQDYDLTNICEFTKANSTTGSCKGEFVPAKA